MKHCAETVLSPPSNFPPRGYLVILTGLVLALVPAAGCRRGLEPPGIEEMPIDPTGSSRPSAMPRPPSIDPPAGAVRPAPSSIADGGSDGRSPADGASDVAALPPPPPPTPAPPAPSPPDGGVGDTGSTMGLDRGLLLLLRLEDGPGSLVARDDSGNGNRVSLVGLDPAKAWVPGKFGGGLDFQIGSGARTGHLAVDGSPSLDRIRTALTIAVWIVRPAGRHGSIVARRSAFGASAYQLEIGGGDSPEALLEAEGGPRLALMTDAKVMANRWTHLAFTYDGQAGRLYVDGQVVSRAPYTAPLAAVPGSPLLIAADLRLDPRAPLFPRLDDLRVYDRALSDAEVAALAGP